MGSIKSTLSLTGTVGGQPRRLSATNTAIADEVYDIEFTLPLAEKLVTIFEVDTAVKTGPTVDDFKQLVAHNTGSTTVELMLYLSLWEDASPPVPESPYFKYLSLLMYPGDYLSLPNPRMILFDTDDSAAFYQGLNGQTTWDSISVGTASPNSMIITDGGGNWSTTNFPDSLGFGGAGGGITPGTMRFAFYSPAEQAFGLTKNGRPPVTANTDTQLAGATLYDFRITVDGVTSTIAFTTGASSAADGVTLGSVLKLITSAFYAADVKADMMIENGDIVTKSRSRNVATSQITFAAGVSNTVFGKGIIPVIGSILAQTDEARMEGADDIMWETAAGGVLTRKNGGTGIISDISVTDGAVSITGAPANSTIDVFWVEASPHSGPNNSVLNGSNVLMKVLARSIVGKGDADVGLNNDATVRIITLA